MASQGGGAKKQAEETQPTNPPAARPLAVSRWQLTISSLLLLSWILFLAWIAFSS